MSGYDRTRFVQSSDKELDEFTCGICHEIFNKPVVTNCCQQTYCSDCINEWLNNKNTCPNDRKQLSKKDLRTPPKVLLNLLGNLKVSCDYEKEGCQLLIELDNFENHVKKCEYKPMSLCETCLTIRDKNLDHNCIQTLLNENKKLNAEKEKLLNQNETKINHLVSCLAQMESQYETQLSELEANLNQLRLKQTEDFRKLKKTFTYLARDDGKVNEDQIKIESARFNINNYTYTFKDVSQRKLEDLFEMCRQSVLFNDSIGAIRADIMDRLSHHDRLKLYKLTVSINQQCTDLSRRDFIFEINFGLLQIKIYGGKFSFE